ncbi:hypothetical protein F5X97DRAFT_342416 [Nemania serpens]|nr:hypothetical protein F5X97DRAFT_342416 [Nemania serpens]
MTTLKLASLAEKAFQAVRKYFEESGSLSEQDRALLKDKSSIESMQQVVAASLKQYASEHQSKKTIKWLLKLSETIVHYGEVLDVFVQHHPEYVALVWGTMKLLFTSVVNHEATFRLLTKTTAQIALRLPRMTALSQMYRTAHMQQAIEKLYSFILEFLLMAHGWCGESRLRQIYHSLTRPHELRYGDLLGSITDCSKNILELATLGSQAEIRVIRKFHDSKLDEIIATLNASEKLRDQEMRRLAQLVVRLETSGKQQDKKLEQIILFLQTSGATLDDIIAKIEAFRALSTSAQLNTNQQLSDIQLSQALSTFSLTFENPENCYRHYAIMRRRRVAGLGNQRSTNEFWLSPRLRRLSNSQCCDLVIIKGTFAVRQVLQDFGVDVISSLMASSTPVIWGFPTSEKNRRTSMLTATELIQSLTYQVLRFRGSVGTEKQLGLRYKQFHTSTTTQEWLELLKQVIISLETRSLYLVVDLASYLTLLNEVSKPIVKTVLLAYQAHHYNTLPANSTDSIITVRIQGHRRQQGKTMRRALTQHSFGASSGRRTD